MNDFDRLVRARLRKAAHGTEQLATAETAEAAQEPAKTAGGRDASGTYAKGTAGYF